jgi:hypothetical protein
VARLQAYEAGNEGIKSEEFTIINLILGTPIPDTPIPDSPRAVDFPEDYPMSDEEDDHGSK